MLYRLQQKKVLAYLLWMSTAKGSTSFVASDNYKVGEMLADAVIEQLDGKGKIAIIDGITVTSLKDRTEGFMDKNQRHRH